MSRFLRQNWFILGLFAAVVFGLFLPRIGLVISGGTLTSSYLVVLIFFMSGFTLPREVIRNGLTDIRFHLFIQVFIFIAAPLYFFLSSALLKDFFSPGMLIGIYALAVLPTTISSCIIFTQASGGNVVGTMFNAALSNILGIVISPLLLSFLLNTTGHPLEIKEALRIFYELGYKMLLPIVAGQAARAFFRKFADGNKKRMGVLSNSAILVIVLITISKTAQNPLFFQESGFGFPVLAYLALSYCILAVVVYWGARLLKFPRENLISALYAAPQKTLALGVPLLSTYFANDPSLRAVAILPLLFYHPWQLFVSGIIKDMPFLKNKTS